MLLIDWSLLPREDLTWITASPVTKGGLMIERFDWEMTNSASQEAEGDCTLLLCGRNQHYGPPRRVETRWQGRMIGDWPQTGRLAVGEPVQVRA